MSNPGYTPPNADVHRWPFLPPNPWGPFTAGDMVRRAFEIYRQNFGLFLAIGAIGGGIITAAAFPSFRLWLRLLGQHGANPAPQLVPAMLGLFALSTLFAMVAIYFVTACALGASIQAVALLRRGQQPTLGDVLEATVQESLPLSGTVLLGLLFVFLWLLLFLACALLAAGGVAAIVYLLFHGAHGGHAGPPHHGGPLAAVAVLFAVLGYLAFLGGYFWFLFWVHGRYWVALPAVVEEGFGPWGALSRSVELTRGNKGRIYVCLLVLLGLSLVAYMVSWVPMLILFAPTLAKVAAHTPPDANSFGPLFGALFCVVLFSQFLLVYPWAGISMALCYYDLRGRAEPAAVPAAPAMPVAPLPGTDT